MAKLRSKLCESAGVVISTPEYAHGVPGVLKNALDWLVASGEFYEKPVALFSASTRGTYAQASLTETLNVMTARIVPEACIAVPLLAKNLDESGIIAESEISRSVCSALARFADAAANETLLTLQSENPRREFSSECSYHSGDVHHLCTQHYGDRPCDSADRRWR